MHDWSDRSVDWAGINDAAEFIGLGLRRWGRVSCDYKEKWGTVRVSLMFGWYSLHNLTHPGYSYIQWPRLGHLPLAWLNWAVVPYQERLYRWFYRRALKRWPHLRQEILQGADYPELLENL